MWTVWTAWFLACKKPLGLRRSNPGTDLIRVVSAALGLPFTSTSTRVLHSLSDLIQGRGCVVDEETGRAWAATTDKALIVAAFAEESSWLG